MGAKLDFGKPVLYSLGMEPKNHRVTFQYDLGREVTGDVVWLQQRELGVAELVLVCSDIVYYGIYTATYRTPSQRAMGSVSIMSAQYVGGWCVYGRAFTRNK